MMSLSSEGYRHIRHETQLCGVGGHPTVGRWISINQSINSTQCLINTFKDYVPNKAIDF